MKIINQGMQKLTNFKQDKDKLKNTKVYQNQSAE